MEAWQEGLIEALEAASDLERQRASWIDRKGFFPDPAELICSIFDDSAFYEPLARGTVFSQATDAALSRLGTLADRVEVYEERERLLSSEVWIELARDAARVAALVRADLAK